MSANSMPKEKSLKHAVLCASFDRRVRAEILNKRESVRLDKHYRSIEAFKNSIAKEHVAETNRVKSRTEDLRRKAVLCRSRSNSTDTVGSTTSLGPVGAANRGVHLPMLPKPTRNSGKMSRVMDLNSSVPNIHLFYAENEDKSANLPIIALSSPQSERRFKIRDHNVRNTIVPRLRTQSHGDLRSDERMMVDDINSNVKTSNKGITLESEGDKRLQDDSHRREFLDIKCFQGNSRFARSRRRSLSTGDISLTERIHSFLEGVENCRVSSDSLDYSSSYSEEEKDDI